MNARNLFAAFLILIGTLAIGQTFTGTTVPKINDVQVDSLRKINKGIVGSLKLNVAQATASTSAASIAARPDRRGIVIRNLDAAITIYVSGAPLVSSSNGMPLKAGESISIDTAAAVFYVAASGSPVIAYLETYDGPN